MNRIGGQTSELLANSLLASETPNPVIDKKRINIEGYLAYQRNRKARAGGGIATLVSDNTAVDSIKVKEGQRN